MAVINIKGDICSNEDKWIYDYLEWDATCPNDVKSVLDVAASDEAIDVLINSGGGSVLAGQEIYTALRGNPNVNIKIQSLAGSAAGVIAMAGRNEISPVAMIMIHNVSMVDASGDYHDMQKNAEILKQMNAALAQAFVHKTGKTEDEILKLMDRETWLTANQCVENGFVDKLTEAAAPAMSNSIYGTRLTDEIREKVIREKKRKEELLSDLDQFGVKPKK